MSSTDETDVNILLKSWEILQNLSKSNGETAWKIKSWGVTVWSALMAYAFKENTPEIAFVSILFTIIIFIIEVAVRRIQYNFIQQSIEIEESINSILTKNPDLILPPRGISTNIDTPEIKDIFKLLTPKRFLFWFPYVIMLLASIIYIRIY